MTAPLWSVPVSIDDVTEAGLHLHLVADEATRAAVARAAGLRDLPRLEASFDVARKGSDSLKVVGDVSATVGQDCVVTLEPVENEVHESIDLVFAQSGGGTMADDEGQATLQFQDAELPESMPDGVVDLGALATEYLLLGIDPYPRKPDAIFENPGKDEPRENPFAVLSALKKPAGGDKS
ncbi:MAG: DUF177 domain-containing protein [Pseudorhodoplanes sp.]|nr:DUF177 domain-containing protein [Pseudorhodoplanes sp.]